MFCESSYVDLGPYVSLVILFQGVVFILATYGFSFSPRILRGRYDADDCPPNSGVYRTSRVRLSEDRDKSYTVSA